MLRPLLRPTTLRGWSKDPGARRARKRVGIVRRRRPWHPGLVGDAGLTRAARVHDEDVGPVGVESPTSVVREHYLLAVGRVGGSRVLPGIVREALRVAPVKLMV